MICSPFAPEVSDSCQMGSMQTLASGNFFISWGTLPSMTEHTPDGSLVAEFEWGVLSDHNAASYRGFKMRWTAQPYWPPTIASAGGDEVFVSWNGATEVYKWAIVSDLFVSPLLYTLSIRPFVLQPNFSTNKRRSLPILRSTDRV